MEIIPAILAKEEAELATKLAALPPDAVAVHVDFLPRGFLEGFLGVFSSLDSQNLARDKLRLEAHLMLPHPQEYISDLVKAGFQRIVVQIESMSPEVFAELVHEWRGADDIAPSLEMDTPLEVIDSFAHEIESVQLMGIAEIGAQGRPFDSRVIHRVKTLHTKYPHLTIAVDGGVKKENAEKLVAAGAERLVVGSAIGEFFKTWKNTPPFPSPYDKGRV